MSQAPGLSGTPEAGPRASATTSVSCARSSASPTSRTIRVSPAMSLADSILQTASIARCVPAIVTASDPARASRSAPRLRLRGRLRDLLPELNVLFDGLAWAEILELKDLANLDLALPETPPLASSTPALTSSSLYLAIAASCSSVGRTPASESWLALTIIMNRIVHASFVSKWEQRLPDGLHRPGNSRSTITTNEARRNRHDGEVVDHPHVRRHPS